MVSKFPSSFDSTENPNLLGSEKGNCASETAEIPRTNDYIAVFPEITILFNTARPRRFSTKN